MLVLDGYWNAKKFLSTCCRASCYINWWK